MFRTLVFSFFKLTSLIFIVSNVHAHSIEAVVAKIKPSVVGVGLYDALGAQTHQLRGTGFVFGDGSLVATNYHVVSHDLDPKVVQYHIVFSGSGRAPNIHRAEIIAKDPIHDLAILKLDTKLTPVVLASDEMLNDGAEVLLTGFPIGAILGLFPATHRGIVAASSPDVIPSVNSNMLSNKLLEKLKNPYLIYQLDITAYPGNSGSPLYNADNGEVVGVLNKVFIKESKETVLEKPSGISYAIPIKYLKVLANGANL
ncbi:S1 family peptidase [Paraglaciecola hydrolytica]|uniref:Peptidase S1 n=1 Tax=Paraglaciecola hydrolytica TaxID=1799789 RepID=A0A135ZZX5_9ALTE|nr:serine protease [Paraglaciecola hydrolytica]KXI28525.1 peptidase S1 [Paraglaciecola hydrolytica]